MPSRQLGYLWCAKSSSTHGWAFIFVEHSNAGFNFLHAGVNDNDYQQVINLAGSRGIFLCTETLDKIYQFKNQNPFCWNAADDANVNFSAEQVRDRTNEIKSIAPFTLSIIAVTNSGSSDAPRFFPDIMDNPRLGYLSAPREKHVVKGCP